MPEEETTDWEITQRQLNQVSTNIRGPQKNYKNVRSFGEFDANKDQDVCIVGLQVKKEPKSKSYTSLNKIRFVSTCSHGS